MKNNVIGLVCYKFMITWFNLPDLTFVFFIWNLQRLCRTDLIVKQNKTLIVSQSFTFPKASIQVQVKDLELADAFPCSIICEGLCV